MSKQAQLDELKAQILADDVTPQLRQSATQLVFGVGDPDADIVFIGEAPGKKEDELGEPFIGAAGKFLNEMLESIHLKRAQIYITNIVKYRPPNNRDPEPEEKKAFLPYLIKQIDIIKPKLIATLGRHSGGLFLPELKISQDHGQPKRIKVLMPQGQVGNERVSRVQGDSEKQTESYGSYDDGASELATQQSATKHGSRTGLASRDAMMSLVILPLYHPAAALYNGGQRQTLMEDFSKIPEILNLINKEN